MRNWGCWASQAYAVLAADREDPILGVLNFDMIGFNDLQQRLELVTNPGSRWLGDQMASVAERYSIGLNIDLLEDGARVSAITRRSGRGATTRSSALKTTCPRTRRRTGVREGRYRINSQYHSVVDLPDSLNWELVRRTTQLAVADVSRVRIGRGHA